jgi:TonB family protein
MSLVLVSFTWETPRMSINLIESERRSQRSLAGTFVSVALHAAVITLAVYATANAGVLNVHVPVDTVHIVYTTKPTEQKHEPSHPVHDPHPTEPVLDAPHAPVIKAPIDIPDHLPPIDVGTRTAPAESLFAIGEKTYSGHGAAGSSGADAGEPMFASQVEKAAAPRTGNPFPKYPSVLESSRIEGIVLVQFVVDTLGAVDMRTFKVLESSNELFAQSLAATLPKWRFYPAEAGGRRVNQIVQLPLKFVAPHR